ncbi:carbohydrate ABC transporter permease [Nocardiopsis ganjiahuensis]|uniref:carbohydrate ABC transporter permease n=1 Tax=Nocardiopsis ganjiahuensis TaxID=239984 RepID=UPI00034C329A|nr:sugar ABC transporter permease [Nocardiopsis ganjiahuensis]
MAPTVLGALYLLLYPLLRNIVISLQHFRMGELVNGGAAFVGLDNYREILDDPVFWDVVRRTFGFTIANVTLIMVLATLVSLLLMRLGRGARLLVMGALVLTWATPVIAATTIFQWMFQSELGVVNWLLVRAGFTSFQSYSWFASGTATFWIIVVLVVWQSVPFAAITLYAAQTTIPHELYEAARIDGAGPWRLFTTITLPMTRTIFGLITCLEIIWVFKAFAQIWAISQGGPGGATTILQVYAFRIATLQHRYDLAGAASTITVVILMLVLVVYFRHMYRQEALR